MKKFLLSALALCAASAMFADSTVLFEDDFEWLEPWSVAGEAGETVGTNDVGANAPNLHSVSVENVTAWEALVAKGYTFLYDKDDNKRIYLQKNYLKFGKTGNHAGVTLPAFEAPADQELTLTFDWCGMRQGSGKIDPVNLIVKYGETEVAIPELGWENDHVLEWVPAKVEGIKLAAGERITITETQWDIATANRYFLDNIKVTAAGAGVANVAVDANAPVEYFNLNGIRVANPENGIFIRRQGANVSKVIVK